MNTHRRAWLLRAGVVAALVAGAQLGAGSPAQADPPTVQVVSLSSASLDPGDRATLRFSIQNNNNGNPPGADNTARVTVRTDFGELRCDGRCEFDEQINGFQPRQFQVTLVAGEVEAGETKSGKVRIEVTINNETGTAERDVTVRGPQEAPSAKKVSGQVVDVATGEAIPAAAVAMQDSQNHTFNAETDDRGRFSFTSSGRNPISPGRIDIAVGLTGYANVEKQFEIKRGQSLTGIKISLTSTASPSPTAEPSAVTTPPAAPSEAALDPAAGEDGGGTLSWVLILLGGLLVALGVGAIVLLIVRRRQEAREEDANGEGPGGGPPMATPPGRGGYRGDDATRIVGGAGMGGDPTMVGRPSLADAPTMLQAPVRDEYPDPYGLPPQQPGAPTQAYGAAAQPGWGGGYSDATQVGGYPGAPGGPGAAPAGPPGGFGPGGVPAAYGSPVVPGGYGQPGGYEGGRGPAGGQGGRGEFADRYDDPTGRFTAPGADGGPGTGRYGDPAPGYAGPTSGGPPPGYAPTSGGPPPGYASPTSGAPNGGYGPPGAPAAYDQRGYGADPYDSGQAGRAGGYPGPPSSAGGYASPGGPGAPGGPPGGGYDQRRGYEPQDTGGYGGPSGYDQRGGGYAGPAGTAAPAGGGYDPRGGYPSANPPAGYPPPSGGYEPATGGYDDAGQRGSYDAGGYEQGGYYNERGGQPPRQPGPPPQAPPQGPQPPRSERRSLDWLDD